MMLFWILILLLSIYWIYKEFIQLNDLKALGIPHDKPWPIFGNILPVLLKRQTSNAFTQDLYRRYSDQKLFGFYGMFGIYTIVICDPAILKQIAIKDFEFFVNRDRFENHHGDKYLSNSVLLMRGQKWKDMRMLLNPIFTTAKLKQMHILLNECVSDFMNLYEEKVMKNGGRIEIDTHDVFSRVTADGIATAALGFKGDCVRNEESEIFKIADAVEADFTRPSTLVLLNVLPAVWKLLRMQIFRKSVQDFFKKNIIGEMKRREEFNVDRPDIINVLLQANAAKKSESYSGLKGQKINKWTENEIIGQAVALFLGGFETTALTMQVCCFELAWHPEIQQILIDEVEEMKTNLDGKEITYEQLNSMKFLEMVISEVLRKWPSFRFSSRNCGRDYVLQTDDGRSFKIKRGTDFRIPNLAIQMDQKYFKNPEKFDPHRFSDENKANIPTGAYIPFGIGPRICIGQRYALLESKLLLYSLISVFTIEKCSKTPKQLTANFGNAGYQEPIIVALKMRR